MTDEISLLMFVLALATGLGTSVVAASHMQRGQPVFFRYFLSNILLFNLLILSGMVLRYLQVSLRGAEQLSIEGILPALFIGMAALKLGWLYAFILMNRALPADVLPERLSVRLAWTGGAVFVAYAGFVVLTWLTGMNDLQQVPHVILETIVIGGAVIATLHLTRLAYQLQETPRRMSIFLFGVYHLCLMGVILIVTIAGWIQPGPQKFVQLMLNGGFLFLYNLFPLIWLRWFQPVQKTSDSEKFELMGITRREKEIIALIQAGMTNQEIADELHISVATVKDHNHNIFRKCGTRNRLELAKLFQ